MDNEKNNPIEKLATAMYKNNSRVSSKLKRYSPLQLSCNLIGNCDAVGYYSYTKRCMQGWKSRLKIFK